MYEADAIKAMKRECNALTRRLRALVPTSLIVRESLRNADAKSHLAQGVGRRLQIIARCIEQLFALLPPDADAALASDQLTDLNINIHALLVNVAGLLDDLAWVFAYESADPLAFEGKPMSVSLFRPGLQAVLPSNVLTHVLSKAFSTWYTDYAKDYRDAVAHHIPPYVAERTFSADDGHRFEELQVAQQALHMAPRFDYEEAKSLRAEQDMLGKPSLMMTHAFSGPNQAKPILFHAQAICDGLTIAELLDVALAELKAMRAIQAP